MRGNGPEGLADPAMGTVAADATGADAAASATAGTVAGVIAAVAIATILGALAFQHLFHYLPCALCLQQRWPYYAAIPLAAVLAAGAGRFPVSAMRTGLAVLAVVFLGSAAFGAYHAGVEWRLWEGPRDCGGPSGSPSDLAAMMRALEVTRIVSCTEAAWRFLGVSLAGWNVVVSSGLAALAFFGLRASRPRGA